jgi:signal transduction histidine kinase
MTLLSQLGLWVTGSDLNKNLKKLRIIITLLTCLLFGLLLIANTYASTYYTTQALESRRPINGRGGLNSNMPLTQFELERRQFEQDRRKEYIDQQFDVTVFANVLLLLILTGSTYFLLYPLLKPIQTESENREKFLSHASHELRTPLAVIHSNLALAPTSPIINQALIEIKKLQNLSNRILSGYQSQPEVPKGNNYTAHAIVNEIINDLQPININNIQFKIDNISEFNTNNYIELYQILYNAISNIYYYSTPNSTASTTIDNQLISISNITPKLEFTKGVGIEIMEQEANRINLNLVTTIKDNRFSMILTKK